MFYCTTCNTLFSSSVSFLIIDYSLTLESAVKVCFKGFVFRSSQSKVLLVFYSNESQVVYVCVILHLFHSEVTDQQETNLQTAFLLDYKNSTVIQWTLIKQSMQSWNQKLIIIVIISAFLWFSVTSLIVCRIIRPRWKTSKCSQKSSPACMLSFFICDGNMLNFVMIIIWMRRNCY